MSLRCCEPFAQVPANQENAARQAAPNHLNVADKNHMRSGSILAGRAKIEGRSLCWSLRNPGPSKIRRRNTHVLAVHPAEVPRVLKAAPICYFTDRKVTVCQKRSCVTHMQREISCHRAGMYFFGKQPFELPAGNLKLFSYLSHRGFFLNAAFHHKQRAPCVAADSCRKKFSAGLHIAVRAYPVQDQNPGCLFRRLVIRKLGHEMAGQIRRSCSARASSSVPVDQEACPRLPAHQETVLGTRLRETSLRTRDSCRAVRTGPGQNCQCKGR